jgi:hypothetical protein
VKLDIYRSVKADPDPTTKLNGPKKTMRPPGNVPYVVDNLWEWKRPKGYPNRRCSVFANPDPETAGKSGAAGGTVFRVEFEGEFNLCQLKDMASPNRLKPGFARACAQRRSRWKR